MTEVLSYPKNDFQVGMPMELHYPVLEMVACDIITSRVICVGRVLGLTEIQKEVLSRIAPLSKEGVYFVSYNTHNHQYVNLFAHDYRPRNRYFESIAFARWLAVNGKESIDYFSVDSEHTQHFLNDYGAKPFAELAWRILAARHDEPQQTCPANIIYAGQSEYPVSSGNRSTSNVHKI